MMRIHRVGFVVALVMAFVMAMVGLILMLPLASSASSGDTEWTGIISSRPTGITGAWVVGSISFEAISNVQLVEEHGALTVGACARVVYHMSSGVNVASNISSQELSQCSMGSYDHDEHTKVYSYVNALPAGFPITLTGEWVIGNVTYTAVNTTHFEQDNGAFAVGQCVGVEYISGTTPLALVIETVPAYKCLSVPGGGVPHAVIRGVLDSFPAGLVGTWIVSGTAYTATTNTHFEQQDGPFFAGGCVEVNFNPTDKVAYEISTEEAFKCGGARSAKEEFFGVIDSIPTGTLGVWVISGTSFMVTTTTQLEEEHGPLDVGVCAEVEYVLSGTDKIATEISSEEMFKCGTGTSTNEAIGTISSFPPGLYGTWVITRNGDFTDTFQANTGTEFNQEHGNFAAGVCVKVKYFTQGGVNYAVEIEAEDAEHCGGTEPPEPGRMNIVFATIDQFPTSTPPVGLWIIGGVEYSATLETHFGQEHGSFGVGACVKALYSVVSGTNILHEVQTKDEHKCIIGGRQVFRSFGVIESFPADLIGDWRISNITYTAGTTTTFEQEHGFFAVGAFVEVKYILSGTTRSALSIETHVAPGAGRGDVIGVLQEHDMSDDWSPWVVNGVTYQSDPAIEVRGASQMAIMGSGPAVAVGQVVHLNYYRGSNGSLLATSVSPAYQLFLPLAMR